MQIIIIDSGQSLLKMKEAVLDVFEAIQAQFGCGGVKQILKRITAQLAVDDHARAIPDPGDDNLST